MATIRLNDDRLVAISVQGEITHPVMRQPFSVGGEGQAWVLPKYGGITFNVRVGDRALGWLGDHVEPGVSIKNPNHEANAALIQLSCIGNEARVLTGDAKGARGRVTGGHGGVDHTLVDFPPEVLEKLAVGDKVLVRAWGQGLAVLDPPQPGLTVMNVDPRLLVRLVEPDGRGGLRVRVKVELKPQWMGSGLGFMPPQGADFDVTTTDPATRRFLEEADLRLGDVVAVRDQWCQWGFTHYPGAVTIGVVVHCDSLYAGHGPGVRVIMTSRDGAGLTLQEDWSANIARLIWEYGDGSG